MSGRAQVWLAGLGGAGTVSRRLMGLRSSLRRGTTAGASCQHGPAACGVCERVTIRVLDSTFMLHERADVVGPRWPQNATAPVTRNGRRSRARLAVC